ncbi:MAG: hypothetical protein PHU85_07240 [Phycisphaerae bacterium]|nr:hypothetical protein [Phycisphaerae bacterium]
MLLLKQTTAAILKMGPFVDSTDGVTAEAGLSIAQGDIQISKNGGAFTQTSEAAPVTTHDVDGWYPIPLTTTDTGTLGTLKVQVTMSGALPVWQEAMVLTANVYDSLVGGSDNLDVTLADGAHGGSAATLTLKSVSVSNSEGSAVTMASTGANGHGLSVAGNGSGEGITAVGGATGYGMELTGGDSSGYGLKVTGKGDHAGVIVSGSGMGCGVQIGAGSTGVGLYVSGGSSSGTAVQFVTPGSGPYGLMITGGSNGSGVRLVGQGSGSGLDVGGGSTGHGIFATGGSSSGDGIRATGYTGSTGCGATFIGMTSGSGIVATKGASGYDVDADIHGTIDVCTTNSDMRGTDDANTVVPDAAGTASSLISGLETHGDSTWATATGFATPGDLSGLALAGEAATAVTGLATSLELSAVQTHGDSTWATADVSDLATILEYVNCLPASWVTVPTAADVKTALEANGSKLDHLWEMTEDDGGVRRLTENALEQAPAGGGGSGTATEENQVTIIGLLEAIQGAGWTTETLVALDAAIATVTAKTDLITTGNITVVSALTAAGDHLTLYIGDAYSTERTQLLTFIDSTDAWPSLTGATVTFFVANQDGDVELTHAGVVTTSGGHVAVTVTLEGDDTSDLTAGRLSKYDLRAEWADGDRKLLVAPTLCTVIAPITPD